MLSCFFPILSYFVFSSEKSTLANQGDVIPQYTAVRRKPKNTMLGLPVSLTVPAEVS